MIRFAPEAKIPAIEEIYALITSDNPPSLTFHEKRGFRFVAKLPECGIKFGKLYSVVWMEKVSNSVEIPNIFPISVSQVVNIHSLLE